MTLGLARSLLLALGVVSCHKQKASETAPAAIGETFSFHKSVGGVEWDCTVLDSVNLGKKLTRTANLAGDETTIMLVPTDAADHFERLHVKVTNRGHSSGATSPELLTIDPNNRSPMYARTLVNQAATDGYLDSKTTPPFHRAAFRAVEPGETREYWEITEVPDAVGMSVFSFGLDADHVRFVVDLRSVGDR